MSGVSVSGLSSVDRKTVFVTKAGATSNSRARIVVKTATGIEASITPDCLAAPDNPRNEVSPSATIGATISDKPTATATTGRTLGNLRSFQLHPKHKYHHRKRCIA